MTDFGRAPTHLFSARRVNSRNHGAKAGAGDALPWGKSGMACRADTPGIVAGPSRHTQRGTGKRVVLLGRVKLACGRDRRAG